MSNYFDDYYAKAHKDYQYVATKTYLKVAKNVETIMSRRGLNNTELAELLGCSKPYITKILSGDVNLTIATLAKLSIALDCNLTSELVCKEDADKSEKELKEIWKLFNEVKTEFEAVKNKWDIYFKSTASNQASTPSKSVGGEMNIYSILDHKEYAPKFCASAA